VSLLCIILEEFSFSLCGVVVIIFTEMLCNCDVQSYGQQGATIHESTA
jgi:hypothetical protein